MVPHLPGLSTANLTAFRRVTTDENRFPSAFLAHFTSYSHYNLALSTLLHLGGKKMSIWLRLDVVGAIVLLLVLKCTTIHAHGIRNRHGHRTLDGKAHCGSIEPSPHQMKDD